MGRIHQEVSVRYLFHINTWSWSYSFGVNNTSVRDEPYLDFRHLTLSGAISRPKRSQIENAKVTLIPDDALNAENWSDTKPRAVGSLVLRDGEAQCLLSLSTDALNPVLTALTADALRFVIMDGARLRYRKALIHSYRLEAAYDEENFPLEDG